MISLLKSNAKIRRKTKLAKFISNVKNNNYLILPLIPAILFGRVAVVVLGRRDDDFYLVIRVLFSFLIVLLMIHCTFIAFIFLFRNKTESQ